MTASLFPFQTPEQTAAQAVRFDAYALRAARKYLESMEYYGHVNVPVGDGKMTTPTYARNMLMDAVHMRGDQAKLAECGAVAEDTRGGRFWIWTVYAEWLIAELG